MPPPAAPVVPLVGVIDGRHVRSFFHRALL
jgi:hypothetical protein